MSVVREWTNKVPLSTILSYTVCEETQTVLKAGQLGTLLRWEIRTAEKPSWFNGLATSSEEDQTAQPKLD